MTPVEMKETIACIYAKGFFDETDKHNIWAIHKEILGQFQGNLNCVDCIRTAVKNLTLYFETNVK